MDGFTLALCAVVATPVLVLAAWLLKWSYVGLLQIVLLFPAVVTGIGTQLLFPPLKRASNETCFGFVTTYGSMVMSPIALICAPILWLKLIRGAFKRREVDG